MSEEASEKATDAASASADDSTIFLKEKYTSLDETESLKSCTEQESNQQKLGSSHEVEMVNSNQATVASKVKFCMEALPNVRQARQQSARTLAIDALRLLPLIRPKQKASNLFHGFHTYIRYHCYPAFLERFENCLYEFYSHENVDSAFAEFFETANLRTPPRQNSPQRPVSTTPKNYFASTQPNVNQSIRLPAPVFPPSNKFVNAQLPVSSYDMPVSSPPMYEPVGTSFMQPSPCASSSVGSLPPGLPSTTSSYSNLPNATTANPTAAPYPIQGRMIIIPWDTAQQKVDAIMQLLH